MTTRLFGGLNLSAQHHKNEINSTSATVACNVVTKVERMEQRPDLKEWRNSSQRVCGPLRNIIVPKVLFTV